MFTVDQFLGGKVLLKQPKTGLRATSDAVVCAACVSINQNETLLDVGAGSGIIGLCVNARIPCHITSIEKQPDLIQLIQENAQLNHQSITPILMDIFQKDQIKGQLFHHVVTNPPFYDTTGQGRRNCQQRTAYQADFQLTQWLQFCMKHLKAKGTLTLIHQPQYLNEILSVLSTKLGHIEIIPIQSKKDTPANRIIVRGKLGDKTPIKILPPLIMHHKNGTRTRVAEKILRQGLPVSLSA